MENSFADSGFLIRWYLGRWIVCGNGAVEKCITAAFCRAVDLENDHSYGFFRKFAVTLKYLRGVTSWKEWELLGSVLADYRNRGWYELFQTCEHGDSGGFVPPKRFQYVDGVQQQVCGLDLLLRDRLEELGAWAHIKTISTCSTAAIWLMERGKGLVGAYSLPCRKPSCPYCSHLVKEGGDSLYRSQAISERGKKHMRYVRVGGSVSFYGRMIFTFPKVIQDLVDRRDLVDYEKYGSVDVYGAKIEREISALEREREDAKLIEDREVKVRVLKSLNNKIDYKRRIVKKFKEYGKELRELHGRRMIIQEQSQDSEMLQVIQAEIKKLSSCMRTKRRYLEEGRIILNDIQRAPFDFLREEFGVHGILVTPHLVGDKGGICGKTHFHLHSLFPLFGDEFGFDWTARAASYC